MISAGIGLSAQHSSESRSHHNSVLTAAFMSCTAYLKSIVEDGLQYRGLVNYLEFDREIVRSPAIVVTEVHDDEISCKNCRLIRIPHFLFGSTSQHESLTTQTQFILIISFRSRVSGNAWMRLDCSVMFIRQFFGVASSIFCWPRMFCW